MKKVGTGEMRGVAYTYGSVTEMRFKEREEYVMPESVELKFHGRTLLPTQFDEHGNPQIGGLANLMLIWETRRLVHNGEISSQYDMEVAYSYETTSAPIDIPVSMRLPRADVCPICGKSLTKEDFIEGRLESIESQNAVAHQSCAKEFYWFRTIDEIAERVHLAFGSYGIDEENRFTWNGENGRRMFYRFIRNEYYLGGNPWFLFHTPIGDIKIGWRKRVINITFMENFVPFSMDIFAQENVTKYEENGQRTIHAGGYDKLYEYLVLVRKVVLPNRKEK